MSSGTSDVAERLEQVRARVRQAGGDHAVITVIAVTKGFGPDVIDQAVAAGMSDVGENYAQELVGKWREGLRWHFLGAIQRNKVASLAGRVDVWQSVDRIEEGAAIAAYAPGAEVFVQVNVSGEEQKGGCRWEDVPALVEGLRHEGLRVRGLMAVGPTGAPEDARQPFRKLAATARTLELAELSMGMTADLEVAVQEGSTMVRVGTALFGPRPASAQVRR